MIITFANRARILVRSSAGDVRWTRHSCFARTKRRTIDEPVRTISFRPADDHTKETPTAGLRRRDRCTEKKNYGRFVRRSGILLLYAVNVVLIIKWARTKNRHVHKRRLYALSETLLYIKYANYCTVPKLVFAPSPNRGHDDKFGRRITTNVHESLYTTRISSFVYY